MMKCDMCYDRTSVGKRPMCATVCPSQALAYVPPERSRASAARRPTNVFQFGNETRHHQGLHDGARRAPTRRAWTWSTTCGRAAA